MKTLKSEKGVAVLKDAQFDTQKAIADLRNGLVYLDSEAFVLSNEEAYKFALSAADKLETAAHHIREWIQEETLDPPSE